MLSETMNGDLKHRASDTAEQIAADMTKGGAKEFSLPSRESFVNGEMVTILNEDGAILFDNTGLDWMYAEPYLTNDYWSKVVGTEEWLIYDKMIVKDYHKVVTIVRIAIQTNQTASQIESLKLIMVVGGVLFVALAVCGGFFIAAKSLKPIFAITKTAQKIEKGDLSQRITGVVGKNEIGRLASTINSMLENLEASFKREKQFAADASHELRTPIAIIMNNSEQLIHQAKASNGDSVEAYQTILHESQRMNRIVSQLLSLIRGEEGQYQLNLEKVELCEIITNVIEQFEENPDGNNVHILFAKNQDIIIEADQTLITQLFLNLIENAIKYSKPDGYVRIQVNQIKDSITISVSDNGIGIASEDLPLIFERFYRADKSRDRTGTGLGLSIAKWIVDAHHGKIAVQSTIDEGAEFIITLNVK